MNHFTDLSKYDNSWYHPGGSAFRRVCWYFINQLIFTHGFLPFSSLKVGLLRLFGAKVGIGVTIKPSVNIKYPWMLEIGNYVWIGENVWIDNLTQVKIGNNVCLSQGAMLLTGNHNYSKQTFDLMVSNITLEDGVWIGAGAMVCPGVTCHSHSVLSVRAVAVSDLEPFGIYRGNPAQRVKTRSISS